MSGNNNNGGLIIALGFAVALVIVGVAVADHIKRAATVEFRTPYYAVTSSQRPLLK
ncbi:MAG: hypothetical protein O8C61_03200 [Candidatus Methanoperedens sp.]|nr:hypothetical protein [Candidatus Methanoperedens sp.]